jgi:Spy/CpxP family protein refolding chaperone
LKLSLRQKIARISWSNYMIFTRWQTIAGVALLCCVPAAWAQPKQPGGFGPPRIGDILPGFFQDQLKLTDEQKKKVAEMQKEVEANLAKVLTAEQKKTLDGFRQGKGFGPGPFGPPGGGGPVPPGGIPGGPMPKMGFGPGGFGGFGMGGTGDVKKAIAATEEEWKVIGPKLQKMISVRRAVTGEAGPTSSPALTQAQTELKTVLDDPKHTKAEVDEKIAAVRKAREQARADLVEARRDLVQLLTPTQQAVMVSLGYLE